MYTRFLSSQFRLVIKPTSQLLYQDHPVKLIFATEMRTYFFTFVVKLIKVKYIIQNVVEVWYVETSFNVTTLDNYKN